MAAQPNLKKINQNLRDLMDTVKRELFLEMNCHAVAKVQSFNPATQVVSAQIQYGQQYFQRDPRNGKMNTVLVQYPLLVDCPVYQPGGGGGFITFPIQKGDDCLICFNDRDIENWYAGTPGGAVASDRCHSMADGFALVGIRSKLNAITLYDQSRVKISYQGGKIGVRNKLVLANDTTDFRLLMDTFFTGLSAFLTATASATTASQIAAAAATFVPIAAATKVQFDLLFETEAPL